MLVFLIYLFLAIPALTYLLVRNSRVYKFRMRTLDRISVRAKDDICNGREWMWRYTAFESVSYYEVMWSFRSLKISNFWEDERFVQ